MQVAGKTGTAETQIGSALNNVWFIAFAPAANPTVAIAVTVKGVPGYGATYALPIARRVMEVLLHALSVVSARDGAASRSQALDLPTMWGRRAMIEYGTVIDGRYEVLSRIGTGGMADVYLARDQLLGRQVAVKLLHHRFAEDQEFVERFRREASSAAGLSHPNVVAIFDRGEWDGTYYIAMEYLPGRSLKAVVREQGPLEPVVAIDIVIQILQAARFAHRRGVIHRDLKPHNVILDEEGRAKVTDFGIARAGASDMTLTGSIMGTAQYLSPEQAQGHAVSAASDIYAVGIVLYELLTGTVPFDGETAVTIALKQVSAAPVPPSAVVSHAPTDPPGAAFTPHLMRPERRARACPRASRDSAGARRRGAAGAREGSRGALRRRRRVHRGAPARAPEPARRGRSPCRRSPRQRPGGAGGRHRATAGAGRGGARAGGGPRCRRRGGVGAAGGSRAGCCWRSSPPGWRSRCCCRPPNAR